MQTTTLGKRGQFVIPAKLRRRYGLDDGSLLQIESRDGGLFIRPVAVVPIEEYSPERIAEFLLSNSVTPAEYAENQAELAAKGISSERIVHFNPGV